MKESKNVQEVLGEAVEALIKKDTEKFKEIVKSDPKKTIEKYRVTKDTNLPLLKIIISKLKNVGVENVSLDSTEFSAEGNYPLPIIAAYLNMPEIAQWLIEQEIDNYLYEQVIYPGFYDTGPFLLYSYGIAEYAALFGELKLLKTVILAESFVKNKVKVLEDLGVPTKTFNEVANLSLNDNQLKEVFKIGCSDGQQKILLRVAACAKQIDICKFLIKQGVKLDLKAIENKQFIEFLGDNKDYMDIIKLLDPSENLKAIEGKPATQPISPSTAETIKATDKIFKDSIRNIENSILAWQEQLIAIAHKINEAGIKKELLTIIRQSKQKLGTPTDKISQDSIRNIKKNLIAEQKQLVKIQRKVKEIGTKEKLITTITQSLELHTEINKLISDEPTAATDTALTGETHDAVGDDAAV